MDAPAVSDFYTLRDAAIRLYLENGIGQSQAASKVLEDATVDDLTLEWLARKGLEYEVNKELSRYRREGPTPDVSNEGDGTNGSTPRSGKNVYGANHTQISARYYWLNKPYGKADGTSGPLITFSYRDVEHFQKSFYRAAEANQRVGDFGGEMKKAMVEHDAEVVADLPRYVLEELEGKAGDVLGALGGRA